MIMLTGWWLGVAFLVIGIVLCLPFNTRWEALPDKLFVLALISWLLGAILQLLLS